MLQRKLRLDEESVGEMRLQEIFDEAMEEVAYADIVADIEGTPCDKNEFTVTKNTDESYSVEFLGASVARLYYSNSEKIFPINSIVRGKVIEVASSGEKYSLAIETAKGMIVEYSGLVNDFFSLPPQKGDDVDLGQCLVDEVNPQFAIRVTAANGVAIDLQKIFSEIKARAAVDFEVEEEETYHKFVEDIIARYDDGYGLVGFNHRELKYAAIPDEIALARKAATEAVYDMEQCLLRYFIVNCEYNMALALLVNFPQQQRFFLSSRDEKGRNALQLALAVAAPEAFILDLAELMTLQELLARDKNGVTVLMQMASGAVGPDTITELLDVIPPNRRREYVRLADGEGRTAYDYANLDLKSVAKDLRNNGVSPYKDVNARFSSFAQYLFIGEKNSEVSKNKARGYMALGFEVAVNIVDDVLGYDFLACKKNQELFESLVDPQSSADLNLRKKFLLIGMEYDYRKLDGEMPQFSAECEADIEHYFQGIERILDMHKGQGYLRGEALIEVCCERQKGNRELLGRECGKVAPSARPREVVGQEMFGRCQNQNLSF
jgi:hypothetical protein